MPDYAPPATPRVIYRYVNAGVAHNIQFRGYRGEAESVTLTRTSGAAFGLMASLDGFLCTDFAWLSASYIPQDTNIGHPVALPTPVAGQNLPSVYSPEDKARMFGFFGRSSGGSKCTCEVFGIIITTDAIGTPPSNFILTAVEDSDIAAAVNALQVQNMAAIDNTILSWYPRATIKVNDYWRRQAMKGTLG